MSKAMHILTSYLATVDGVWAGLQCIDYGATYAGRYLSLSEQALQSAIRINKKINLIGYALSVPKVTQWTLNALEDTWQAKLSWSMTGEEIVLKAKKVFWRCVDGLNDLSDLLGFFAYARGGAGACSSYALNVIYYVTSLLLEFNPLQEGWLQFSSIAGPSDAVGALLSLLKAVVSVLISIFSLCLLSEIQGALDSQMFLMGFLLHLNAVWVGLKVVNALYERWI